MTGQSGSLVRGWPGCLLAIIVGCGLFSCGYVRPGKWYANERELCSESGCYEVGPLVAPWTLLRIERNQVAFYNEPLGAIISVNSTCRDDADEASLESLTEHLLGGYTERDVRSAGLLPFAGREALHTVLQAKLDGVPMVLDLYVLKRGGCIFDLSYSAPPDRYPLGSAAFGDFVAGFVDKRRA